MNDQTTKDRSNIWSAIAVVLSLISATILLIQNPASAATGSLVFYEGDGGTQDVVCVVPYEFGRSVNFKNDNYGCDNDEARSVRFENVPSGAFLSVYDSPSCTRVDDVTYIHLYNNTLGSVLVPRFNYSDDSNGQFSITYDRFNGIQGKVSCIQMFPTNYQP
jgi:hypothetical protein